jgi:radical SAM superfamily enzyme with C-terminal helix-hairpin-helix motif
MSGSEPPPSARRFAAWKAEIDDVWDTPMKRRVYPAGLRVEDLHAFFVTESGSWFRRLGSYPIQILETGAAAQLYAPGALTVTGHAPRYVYGQRRAA